MNYFHSAVVVVDGQHLCAQVCSLPSHSAPANSGGGAPAHLISMRRGFACGRDRCLSAGGEMGCCCSGLGAFALNLLGQV